jgi:hypothetical protein
MIRHERRDSVRGFRWLAIGAALVAVAFAVINIDLARRGVLSGGDTGRYTSGAHNLLAGETLDHQQRLYVGYVALVALADELGVGLEGVVAIQIVLIAMGALALFDLGRRLAGPWTGLLAAALFVTSPDFTRFTGWQAYILTDAPYASALAIAVWAIHQARVRRGRWYLAGAIVVVAASLRPQGSWLLPTALIYWIVPHMTTGRSRFIVAAVVAAGFLAVVALAPGLGANTADASPGKTLREGSCSTTRRPGASRCPARDRRDIRAGAMWPTTPCATRSPASEPLQRGLPSRRRTFGRSTPRGATL